MAIQQPQPAQARGGISVIWAIVLIVIATLFAALLLLTLNPFKPAGSVTPTPAPTAPNGDTSSSAAPNGGSGSTSSQTQTQSITININGACVTCNSNGASCNVNSSPAPSDQPSAAPSSAPQGCPAGVRHDRVPKLNQAWHPTEPGGIVMRTWSNQTDPNWPATGVETLVIYGTDPSTRPNAYIGGSYWVWPSLDCAIADIATQKNLATENGKMIVYNLTGQDINVPDGWTVKTSLPDNLLAK